MKEVILTAEGYERLKSEIEYLSNEKRREVADRIRIAREFGDIAENAEYDDAKNEQARLGLRGRDAEALQRVDTLPGARLMLASWFGHGGGQTSRGTPLREPVMASL